MKEYTVKVKVNDDIYAVDEDDILIPKGAVVDMVKKENDPKYRSGVKVIVLYEGFIHEIDSSFLVSALI